MCNVFRIAKLTTPGAIKGAYAHNARVNPTPNADPAALGNKVMVDGGPDLVATILNKIKGVGAKVRKDSVLAVEAVLSASPEYFRPVNPAAAGTWDGTKTQAWAKAHWTWAQKEFGDRIVDARLHLDEATPHLQVIFVPLIKDPGADTIRLSAFELIGRKNLRRMQTESAQAVAHLGIRRGIEGSKATHTSLKQFYAEVNRPAPEEPTPVKRRKTPTPPAMLLEGSREAWAEAENQAARAYLKQEHRRYSVEVRPHLNRSKALDRLTRERNEALATAEAANARAAIAEEAARKAEEKAEAARIRDIPLDRVLAAYGLEKVESGRWMGEGRDIRAEDAGWRDDGRTQARGRGAIALTKHLRQCDYPEAVAWLKQTFGADQTIAAMLVDARFLAPTIVAKTASLAPFSPPIPMAENWPRVRQWLTTMKRLAGDLVDWLHGLGRVYADEKANAVFLMVDERGQPVGAEIESTEATPFATLAPCSSRNAGAFTIPDRHGGGGPLVLVENAIDAISYVHLHPDQHMEVRSTAGARSQIPWLDRKREIIVAFAADQAGDRLAAKLLAALPRAFSRRSRPASKSWNDMIEIDIGRSQGIATRRLNVEIGAQIAPAEEVSVSLTNDHAEQADPVSVHDSDDGMTP